MLPSDKMVIYILLSAGGIIVLIPSIELSRFEEQVEMLIIIASIQGQTKIKQQTIPK